MILLDTDFQKNLSSARKIALDSRMRIGFSENAGENYANSLHISAETARAMLGGAYGQVVKARRRIEQKGKPRAVTVPVNIGVTLRKDVKELLGENMLAYVEGSDLKDELVIVTAHYDHIGKRGNAVFNGADDNGSGTSTVLDVCEAFVQAKANGHGPRRSILFMFVSGEEKGLLGSKFYVENPIFPLENTVANINVDMVGRVDDAHKDNPYYIYVIGADRLSSELHQINEQANTNYTQLELDYTYNAESDPNRYYYRSDHYNFAERGIPAVFYFNGTHDDYHQDTDTVDKINFEKMARIGQLIYHTAWELANRDKRIIVDVKP
ncbi:MAG: M28 family peptidase [Saprospiraceae bacterium]